jgi:hypothetical protein
MEIVTINVTVLFIFPFFKCHTPFFYTIGKMKILWAFL